jgi:membrane dipeptidase
MGIIYSFESANMHEGRIDRIAEFRRRGVRIMGLSYNPGSPFGSGTMSKANLGLTSPGHDAVTEMNNQGISVDLSHSDEPTSFQAIAASRRPVIITHAGCAAVHRHPRNKSDKLLRAVAEKGGVIGIYDLSYLGDYPANPSLDTYMRHLTHALDVCGEDHVGIGSDTSLLAPDMSPAGIASWNQGEAERKAQGVAAPEEGPLPYVRGLESETRWRVIAAELSRRGYSFRVLEKVLGLNFERAFSETW